MIGCEISYGQDDCFAVMGGGMLAEKTGENTVKVGGLLNRNGLDVGDPIEFRQDDYSPAGFTGKITKIKLVDESEGICEFSFAEKVPDPQGKLLVLINRRYSPKNIIIRNCSFHDNYARGLYLKGDSITVENNRFFHNSEGAMEVVSYYVQPPQGIDGAGASNIVIRNNVIDTSGPSFNNFGSGTSFIPAIYLISNIQRTPQEPRMGPDSRTRYPILKDILIEGNKFINFPGAVVSVFSSGNVIIRNNKINATKSVNNDPPYRGSIEVGFSSGAFVLGNKWTSSPYMKNPGLFIDKKTTEDVFWKDNVMKDRTSHGKTP